MNTKQAISNLRNSERHALFVGMVALIASWFLDISTQSLLRSTTNVIYIAFVSILLPALLILLMPLLLKLVRINNLSLGKRVFVVGVALFIETLDSAVGLSGLFPGYLYLLFFLVFLLVPIRFIYEISLLKSLILSILLIVVFSVLAVLFALPILDKIP